MSKKDMRRWGLGFVCWYMMKVADVIAECKELAAIYRAA